MKLSNPDTLLHDSRENCEARPPRPGLTRSPALPDTMVRQAGENRSMTDPAAWWCPLADAAAALPEPARAPALLALAHAIAGRGDKAAAGPHAFAALRLAEAHADAAVARDARRLLVTLVPRYHAQVATDPLRLAAWNAALRSAVRLGMRALEIGTGCGVLAMLAARAGAQVTACERDPVLAAIAEEAIALNGLASQVSVLAKPAESLSIPGDLDAPAELLFLDVFADNLFAFRPFALLRQVRHLLAADARVIPARVTLVAALAHSASWDRLVPGQVAGLDLTPLRAAAPLDVSIGVANSEVQLRSDAAAMVTAVLPDDLPEDSGDAAATLASHGGPVNGIAVWLRLDLAEGHVLEARPGHQPPGFYARARFHPFAEQHVTAPGEALPIRLTWSGRRLWVAPA
jgi:protein arginine N-methyltransferase 7